ncbi:MAG: hypothetical protein RI897_121 [Verrucomicrobiota bacterium]|jgi:hypothetical protein
MIMKNKTKMMCWQAALVACLIPQVGFAQEDSLQVFKAVEVEFGTQPGKVYTLEGSYDLVTWEALEDRVFGHGGIERRLFSARSLNQAVPDYFRLVVGETAIDGLAPWALSGVTINMDDQPGGDLMMFNSESEGIDGGITPDPFTYTYVRTGPDEGQIEIFYDSKKRDVLHLTFTSSGNGTWVRDEYRKGKLKDRDAGIFSVVTDDGGQIPGGGAGGGTTDPNLPTEMPVDLEGLTYSFHSGGHPDRLVFETATSGTEYGDDEDDNEANVFTYTYTQTGVDTAVLLVQFKADKWDEYELTFSNGAQGSFIRKEYKDGELDDTDMGMFSPVDSAASGSTGTDDNGGATGGTDDNGGTTGGTDDNGGTTGGTDDNGGATGGTGDNGGVDVAAAVAVEGFNYSMVVGLQTVRLEFSGAASGTEHDDSGPNSFTYTYEVTGDATANLVIVLKSDKWDEYSLTFTGDGVGTFERTEYDNNLLKDTDSGTFSAVSIN